jgi:type I restriction enzyme, S subunit
VKASTETAGLPRLRFPEYRDAAHWKYSPLGAVASFHKGRGVSKADIDPDGSRPCIRYGELYTRYNEVIGEVHSRTSVPDAELFLSKPNDVIVPASGETKEDIATAACVLLGGIALGGDLNVIRSDQSGPFISYSLNGPLKRRIAKLAQGDTVVHLYPSQLEGLRVAFPELPEQDKVAGCLTSLEAVVSAQARKVEALKTYKRGLIQLLFPVAGEAIPRLRFPEFKTPWQTRPLSDLLAERKQRNRALTFGPREVLSVSGEFGCVNQIELLGRSYAGVSVKEYHVVETGDLVYTKSPLKKNPYGIIKANKGKPGIVSTLYAVYRPTHLSIPSYLDHYFSRDFHVNSYLQPIVRKGAKNDMKVNNEAVLTGEITVPDVAEQAAIADFLDSIDATISIGQREYSVLIEHKRALMHMLFPPAEKN